MAREWSVCGTYRTTPPAEDGGVEWRRVDLTCVRDAELLIHDTRPDVIHHLAAQSSVSASLRDPASTFSNNVIAQYHLLDAMVRHAPRSRIVIAGSSDEYGDVSPEENPVTEDHPLLPLNPYALSKVAQDLMARQYHIIHDLRIIRARPFLQIGPRRSDSFVAGAFARQVSEVEAGMREPIIEVGNVDLRRDFTDVRDVARAFVLLAAHGEDGQVYNIASERDHSPREMLEIMIAAAGRRIDVRIAAERRRRGESPVLIGSSSRLRAATGWKSEISFEQSALDTLNFWRVRTARASVAEGHTR